MKNVESHRPKFTDEVSGGHESSPWMTSDDAGVWRAITCAWCAIRRAPGITFRFVRRNHTLMKFRIVASSPHNPGNFIVQERTGGLRAFVASSGTITQGKLHDDFFRALLRSKNWRRVDDDTWYTREDLERQFARRGRQKLTVQQGQGVA